jgi:hypothetical protein
VRAKPTEAAAAESPGRRAACWLESRFRQRHAVGGMLIRTKYARGRADRRCPDPAVVLGGTRAAWLARKLFFAIHYAIGPLFADNVGRAISSVVGSPLQGIINHPVVSSAAATPS